MLVKIEIRTDEAASEPRIIIITDKVTPEITEIINRISEKTTRRIIGFKGEENVILEKDEIIRIYTENAKTFAVTEKGRYILKTRLYELEERLDKNMFIRISHSEIINLKKVKSFDFSFSGTVLIKLCDGNTAYSSRRYVAKIKKALDI